MKKIVVILLFPVVFLFAGESNGITLSDLKEAVVLLIKDVKELRAQNLLVSDEAIDKITNYKDSFKNKLTSSLTSLDSRVGGLTKDLTLLKQELIEIKKRNKELAQFNGSISGGDFEVVDGRLAKKIKKFVSKNHIIYN